MKEEVIQSTSFLNEYYSKVPIQQRKWHVDNNCFELQMCQVCNSQKVNWSIKDKTYRQSCSIQCSYKLPSRKEKRENTCLERYGTKSNLSSEESKSKRRLTCIEKYGQDNFAKTSQFKKKLEKTCIERYGVTNPSKLVEVKDKISESHFSRYGIIQSLFEYSLRTATVSMLVQSTFHPSQGAS